jgi:hypothetical protein
MGLVPRRPGQYFFFNAAQPMLFESHMTIFHGQLESVPVYLKNFGWNAMKYRADKSLKELLDALQLVILFKSLVSMHYCLSKKDSSSSNWKLKRRDSGSNISRQSYEEQACRVHAGQECSASHPEKGSVSSFFDSKNVLENYRFS